MGVIKSTATPPIFLICGKCEEEIGNCDGCHGDYWNDGDRIYCIDDVPEHVCEDCLTDEEKQTVIVKSEDK